MKKIISLVLVSIPLSLGLNMQASASNCTSSNSKHVAEAIYHEARGEPRAGQIAVANVIKNRTKTRNKSAAAVVRERGQFSYRTKSNLRFSDKEAYTNACNIALGVLNNKIKDNTNGATYFRSGGGSWGRGFKQTLKVGNHVFFKHIK